MRCGRPARRAGPTGSSDVGDAAASRARGSPGRRTRPVGRRRQVGRSARPVGGAGRRRGLPAGESEQVSDRGLVGLRVEYGARVRRGGAGTRVAGDVCSIFFHHERRSSKAGIRFAQVERRGVSRRRRSGKGSVVRRPGGRSDGSVHGPGHGPACEWRRRAPGGISTPRPGCERRATDASPGRLVYRFCAFGRMCVRSSLLVEEDRAHIGLDVGPSAAVWFAALDGWTALAGPDLSRPDTHLEQTGYPPRASMATTRPPSGPCRLVCGRRCTTRRVTAPGPTPGKRWLHASYR